MKFFNNVIRELFTETLRSYLMVQIFSTFYYGMIRPDQIYSKIPFQREEVAMGNYYAQLVDLYDDIIFARERGIDTQFNTLAREFTSRYSYMMEER